MASMQRTIVRVIDRMQNPRPSVGARKRAMRAATLPTVHSDHDPDQSEQPARDSTMFRRMMEWLRGKRSK